MWFTGLFSIKCNFAKKSISSNWDAITRKGLDCTDHIMLFYKKLSEESSSAEEHALKSTRRFIQQWLPCKGRCSFEFHQARALVIEDWRPLEDFVMQSRQLQHQALDGIAACMVAADVRSSVVRHWNLGFLWLQACFLDVHLDCLPTFVFVFDPELLSTAVGNDGHCLWHLLTGSCCHSGFCTSRHWRLHRPVLQRMHLLQCGSWFSTQDNGDLSFTVLRLHASANPECINISLSYKMHSEVQSLQ